MWSAEIVLVCALAALGRPASSFPPIELVATRPLGVTASAEGYVRHGERRIYLITSTAAFRDAMAADTKCGSFRAVRKIASVLVHEEYHVEKPGDEPGAYAAQLVTLAALGLGSTHPVYMEVRRAMLQVQARERSARVLARRNP